MHEGKVTFQRELLRDVKDEVQGIITRHWEEIALNKGSVPLEPLWDEYYRLQDLGIFIVTTARADGRIVGYACHFVIPNLHYASLKLADNDIVYLDKDYRRGLTGKMLIEAHDEYLISLGVNMINYKEKLHFKNKRDKGFGFLLKLLGYKPYEIWHSRRIG